MNPGPQRAIGKGSVSPNSNCEVRTSTRKEIADPDHRETQHHWHDLRGPSQPGEQSSHRQEHYRVHADNKDDEAQHDGVVGRERGVGARLVNGMTDAETA